ncbi:unnamed protein product [Gadus morhua 'NCC']
MGAQDLGDGSETTEAVFRHPWQQLSSHSSEAGTGPTEVRPLNTSGRSEPTPGDGQLAVCQAQEAGTVLLQRPTPGALTRQSQDDPRCYNSVTALLNASSYLNASLPDHRTPHYRTTDHLTTGPQTTSLPDHRPPHYRTTDHLTTGPQTTSLPDHRPPHYRTTERLTTGPCTPRSDHRMPHYRTVFLQIGPQATQTPSVEDMTPSDVSRRHTGSLSTLWGRRENDGWSISQPAPFEACSRRYGLQGSEFERAAIAILMCSRLRASDVRIKPADTSSPTAGPRQELGCGGPGAGGRHEANHKV